MKGSRLSGLTCKDISRLTSEKDFLDGLRSPIAIFYFLDNRVKSGLTSRGYQIVRDNCESEAITGLSTFVRQYVAVQRYVWSVSRALAGGTVFNQRYPERLVSLADERLGDITEMHLPKGFRNVLAIPNSRLN